MVICTCKDQTFDYEQIESDGYISKIFKYYYIKKLCNIIGLKPKEIKNKIDVNKIKKIVHLQAIIRGFLLRKKLKISKCQTTLTFMDENLQNNITNNNINASHNMDIISQSTIAKKENIITNNLEKNPSIMNFNPNVSKSIEYKIEEEIQDKCLDVNLVSYYKLCIQYII